MSESQRERRRRRKERRDETSESRTFPGTGRSAAHCEAKYAFLQATKAGKIASYRPFKFTQRQSMCFCESPCTLPEALEGMDAANDLFQMIWT
ncbi:hypothetical protein FKM82_001047 [Ascaphus truei]